MRTVKTLGLALALSALAANPAQAQNFERGQELFQHHCHVCHGDLSFAAKEGKVKSLAELRKRIAAWASHTGADWETSEVIDVAYYMDKSFYHFKDQK